ncbi:MAG TPA: MOSC domain-containing protein [Candidatus Excrementavichristensenella intestinipullorum]|nr:MOSC domain-containing protein [Candidatus Excrementavichristensenella intestinipullorum]
MGKVMAVCVSGRRGVAKSPVDSAVFLKDWGIEGDAHAGHWHRQVSLLGADKIRAFNRQGAGVNPGDFGENLVVEGIGLSQLPVGALLRCGEVVLEITQIGKDCHSHCQIYQRMGECIMPREGVFARVLSPGVIRVGDQMEVERRAQPYPWQAAVITLSDRCAAGERQDLSGPAVAQRLKEAGYQVAEQLLLPDGEQALKEHLIRLADQRRVDLILTTGGTGFAPRDRTPEATMAVAHRDAPGIAQAIRGASMAITPRAMLSRGVSVIRGGTLIVNLPGSPRACMECMDVFLEVLPHALQLLRGQGGDCARP